MNILIFNEYFRIWIGCLSLNIWISDSVYTSSPLGSISNIQIQRLESIGVTSGYWLYQLVMLTISFSVDGGCFMRNTVKLVIPCCSKCKCVGKSVRICKCLRRLWWKRWADCHHVQRFQIILEFLLVFSFNKCNRIRCVSAKKFISIQM